MKLNLGSYLYPLPDYVNVDIAPWNGVDVLADLTELPWPFRDGQANVIRAVDILEHLGKLTKTEMVAELARVSAPGARVTVRVPCVSHPWALSSLQHAHCFNYNSFDPSYAQPWFDLLSVRVAFTDSERTMPLNRLTRTLCKCTGLIHTLTFELRRKP